MLFFFQAEDGIRDYKVTGVQTCALPILRYEAQRAAALLGLHERTREREGGGSRGAASEELTPTRLVHDVVLPGWSASYPTELTNRSSADPAGIRRVTSPAHASGR